MKAFLNLKILLIRKIRRLFDDIIIGIEISQKILFPPRNICTHAIFHDETFFLGIVFFDVIWIDNISPMHPQKSVIFQMFFVIFDGMRNHPFPSAVHVNNGIISLSFYQNDVIDEYFGGGFVIDN